MASTARLDVSPKLVINSPNPSHSLPPSTTQSDVFPSPDASQNVDTTYNAASLHIAQFTSTLYLPCQASTTQAILSFLQANRTTNSVFAAQCLMSVDLLRCGRL